MEAHLKDCSGCRQALGWMQATRQIIAARPAAIPPADLRARIARAIAEADPVPAPALKAPSRRPLTLRPAFAYGLSFALFAAISGSVLWNAGHQMQSRVHPVRPTVTVAVKPADTAMPTKGTVHIRPRPVRPLVATNHGVPGNPDVNSNDIPLPHFPRVPSVHIHQPQPEDWRNLTSIALDNGMDLNPSPQTSTPKAMKGGKKPPMLPVHHSAPRGKAPVPGETVLARHPKPATTAPPKKSPLSSAPLEASTNHVPSSSPVIPEPAITPRIIIKPAIITPAAAPEVHEASLTDTLRDSVRHMHESSLTSHSFKLSSSVVEAAGIASDRSATLQAVGAGFGR